MKVSRYSRFNVHYIIIAIIHFLQDTLWFLIRLALLNEVGRQVKLGHNIAHTGLLFEVLIKEALGLRNFGFLTHALQR